MYQQMAWLGEDTRNYPPIFRIHWATATDMVAGMLYESKGLYNFPTMSVGICVMRCSLSNKQRLLRASIKPSSRATLGLNSRTSISSNTATPNLQPSIYTQTLSQRSPV